MSTTTTETVQYLEVKPSEIAKHPDNPRHDVGDITDLTASAKDRGILEPLIVAPPHDGMDEKALGSATYLLIAGHRRLAAAKKARLKTVPIVVRNDWTTRGDQVSAMLIENLHRADLSPIEEGEGYQLVMEVEGLTQAKAAARVQQTPKRVRDRVKLVKLPKGVQARIHDGQITLTEGIEAAAFAGDDAVMKKLEKAAGSNNFAHELALAKRNRKDEQDWRSLVKQIRDAGYTELYGLTHSREDDAQPTSSISGLYSYAYDNAGKWSAEKRTHADCPHRAVIFLEHGALPTRNTITFMCTQPDVHTTAPRGVEDTPLPETPEERAAREAEDAERTAREQARLELQTMLAAAATVRREHVAQVLHHKTGDEDLAKQLLIEHHSQEFAEASLVWATRYWGTIAGWLRLDPDLTDGRDEALRNKLTKLSLPALAMLTRLAWHSGDETNMANSAMTWPSDDDAIAWMHHLTDDFGYPWSDFEKDHFGLDADGHVPAPADDDTGEQDQ